MPTKTKQVLDGLAAVLAAQANCPPLARNRALPAELPAFRGVYAFASLVDGNGDVDEEMLGAAADDAIYEIAHTAVLVVAVEGDPDAMRDTVFDDVLVAVGDAMEADRTLGLGDDVYARVARLETESVPSANETGVVMRMGELDLEITFQSMRPY